MDKKKDWFYYFNESMSSVGFDAPEGLFGSFKKAGETIGKLVLLFSNLPAAATLTELSIAFGVAGKGAIAGSIAMTQGIIVTGGMVIGGISAAAYIGACIGAAIYATQMMTIGDFTFAEADIKMLINQAQKYNIAIPQNAVLKMIASKPNTLKSVAA